ncbi:hypothetical protein D3C81_2162990 [compost metagenome]
MPLPFNRLQKRAPADTQAAQLLVHRKPVDPGFVVLRPQPHLAGRLPVHFDDDLLLLILVHLVSVHFGGIFFGHVKP